jgi:hypothetical protein
MVMRRSGMAAFLGVLVAGQACRLDKVEIPEGLVGPAGQGIQLTLAATPDYVIADNESQSQITATVWGPDGRPLAGREIIFELTDPTGIPAAIGELSPAGGLKIAGGASATAATNSQGIAQVVLSAPARTDILAPTNVVVRARPVGTDYNGVVWRQVRVQVIPAEPRLFPPNPTNALPSCNFTIQPFLSEYRVGQQILFQSAAADTDGRIVRYEWDFGDGTRDDKPDVNHAYRTDDLFTVTHTVTDNNGGQAACTATIVVRP